MDIPWEDAQLFLAVADAGSVTAASKALRLGQPTVSRRLRELEDRLGAPLFVRSKEGVTLTTRGERLLEPAQKMAEWAAELSRAAEKREARLSGVVRVTAPPGIAFDFVAPFAAFVKTKFPDLRLEVRSSVEYLDLQRGAANIALRLRAPTQRDLVSVHSVDADIAACVSKSLQARLPKKPRLDEIPWITWAPPFQDLPPTPQLEGLIKDFVPAFSADDFLVQLRAAEAGLGAVVLGQRPHRFARKSGLVPLDLDLSRFGRWALHVVVAKTAVDVPRIRAVLDLLSAEL